MVTAMKRARFITSNMSRSRSSLYNDIKEGFFTKPVSLGPRAVGWPENEIEAISSARIAGKTPDEIRELVKSLESARKGISEVGS